MSLTLEEMLQQPPGWVSDPPTKAGTKNGKLRYRVYARDCKKGERAPSLVTKEFTGDTERDVFASIDAYRKKLWARFPSGRVVAAKRTSPMLGDVLDMYIKDCQNEEDPVAQITLRSYKIAKKAVEDALGRETLLEHLTRPFVREQLGGKRCRNRQRMGVLRRAIDVAIRDNVWNGDNVGIMPRTRRRAKTKAKAVATTIKRNAVPMDDCKRLLDYVATLPDGPQWLAFYYLAWMTGPRTTDLFDAQRSLFNPKEGTLHVDSKSAAGDRHIILSPWLVKLLLGVERYHQQRGYTGPYLFPAQGGGRLNDSNFAKTVLGRHLLAAGLATEIGPGPARYDPDRKRTRKTVHTPWTMYSFRHGVGTMDEGHVPPHHIDAQLGHENNVRIAHPNAASLPYFNANDQALYDERRRSVIETEKRRGLAVLPAALRHLKAV